jgi:hypothetical protein
LSQTNKYTKLSNNELFVEDSKDNLMLKLIIKNYPDKIFENKLNEFFKNVKKNFIIYKKNFNNNNNIKFNKK